MKRSILMGVILLGFGLAATALAQTAPGTHSEAKSANLSAVLCFLFPGLDPFCLGHKNEAPQKPKPSNQIPLGREGYSLNFDLGFIHGLYGDRMVPAAKIKFGF